MDLIKLDQDYILNTYKRLPIEIVKAKGSYLYDQMGNKYLDMFAGIAVSSLGHLHPKVIQAMKKQMKKNLHLSNYFVSEPLVDLAKGLVSKSFASKVFFTNSGTEAIEASIKLARKYGKTISPNKFKIITLSESFHGRTMGGLTLTAQPKYQESFLPLLPGITYVERNNIKELRKAMNRDVCAIFIEMIQGESGIQVLSREYIDELIKLSKEFKVLIVADEIQTGLLRTGKLFAYEHTNLIPDVLTLAKSLGGGLPLGAMLVSKSLEDILKAGDHGTTFGGNPLAAASGLATFTILSSAIMIQEVQAKSDYLFEKLNSLKNRYKIIKEIRGKGLMIGIEVGEFADKIKNEALAKKVLLNVTNQTVIRLLPPLNMTYKDLDIFLNIFESIFISINTNKNG
ncbi:MAG: aspartate aminotransferase family protein [Firmicutes bacterium]|nr:aspartate aminotransferase family protein [Bacillota bacterium]